MKVTCVGTDPAGLYLGILLRRRDPSHIVRFVDDTPLPSAPAAIICNPLKPRLKLADAETQADADQALALVDKVVVNPENVFDIARGMKEVLLDEKLRSRLIARGIEHAREFSWERAAQQVLQAYEEIASYKKRPR